MDQQQQYFDTQAPQPIFSDPRPEELGENPFQLGQEPKKNPVEGEEDAEIDPKLLEDQQITKAKSVLADDGSVVPPEGVTSDIQNRIMMSLNEEEKKIITDQIAEQQA